MNHAGGPVVLAGRREEVLEADPYLRAGSEDAGRRARTGEYSPFAMAPPVPGATLEAIVRYAILETLEMVGGSTGRAAAILMISPRTIQYKLKKYRSEGIAVPAPCTTRRHRP